MGREGTMLTDINGAIIRKKLNVINVSRKNNLCILISKEKQIYSNLFTFWTEQGQAVAKI